MNARTWNYILTTYLDTEAEESADKTKSEREVIAPKERWVFVSHDPGTSLPTTTSTRKYAHSIYSLVPDEHAETNSLYEKLVNLKYNTQFGTKQIVVFRYEPFLLHVEARNMDAAQEFIAVAVRGGVLPFLLVYDSDCCLLLFSRIKIIGSGTRKKTCYSFS